MTRRAVRRRRDILHIFRTAADRRQRLWREAVIRQGRWLHTQYEADRCAVIAIDAISALVRYSPREIRRVFPHIRRVWPEYTDVFATYITWVDYYRSRDMVRSFGNAEFVTAQYRGYAQRTYEGWAKSRATDLPVATPANSVTPPPDDAERVRRAMAEWDCTREEAVRLATSARMDAWDKWAALHGADNAAAFFEDCGTAMTILVDALKRLVQAMTERQTLQPPPSAEQDGDRFAAILADAATVLALYSHALVTCVADGLVRGATNKSCRDFLDTCPMAAEWVRRYGLQSDPDAARASLTELMRRSIRETGGRKAS
jgi:hypothetical protein